MQIIGQKYNLDIINSWKEMPNFTIIQGDKNTGKTSLVFYMCEKFGLHYVKMKNGINDIRQLIKLMSPNSKTVYHFKDFFNIVNGYKLPFTCGTDSKGNHVYLPNTSLEHLYKLKMLCLK